MVAVGPILDAAGVLNAKPILVQLADDPALGEYRAEFAGMVGTIEERPTDSDNPAASFASSSAPVSISPAVGFVAIRFISSNNNGSMVSW